MIDSETADVPAGRRLGHLDWDGAGATNERVFLRAPAENRSRVLRSQFVRVEDERGRTSFLGRIVAGPFFPAGEDAGRHPDGGDILAEIEVQGEMVGDVPIDTSNRPAPGSSVYELAATEISDLLGCAGDMLLGTLSGRDDLSVSLRSRSKEVLPRNVGIFGTVG